MWSHDECRCHEIRVLLGTMRSRAVSGLSDARLFLGVTWGPVVWGRSAETRRPRRAIRCPQVADRTH